MDPQADRKLERYPPTPTHIGPDLTAVAPMGHTPTD